MKKLVIAATSIACLAALALTAQADPFTTSSAVLMGPQIVGVPVASANIGLSNWLPTIYVDDPSTESLVLCAKAPGGPITIADDHSNAWHDDANVAKQSGNAIHIAFAWHPSAGATNVYEGNGSCAKCYNNAILMLVKYAHGIDADVGNPWVRANKVVNGPVQLLTAKPRLLIACSEIESAANLGLSLGPWPYGDDQDRGPGDIGVTATVPANVLPGYTGVTLKAAVQSVSAPGNYEIDLSFYPATFQAGGLVAIW